ncbi:MAG: hypothetical protein OXI56_02290 [bacterium]|nr:hypothetical protein [bacterium]MDE0600607.1 hypothetical protein [bacterium]
MPPTRANHAAADQLVDVPTTELHFDRRNPRLFLEPNLTKDLSDTGFVRLLWRDFAVDEVALSIGTNGFFRHEPLFVTIEEGRRVVVEGNRRLAAVHLLVNPKLRKEVGATDLPKISPEREKELESLPVVECKRSEVWQFIGFKHVNGPQSWQSYAKAQYVAWVHDELGVPLPEVARRIGDRHTTVRRLYRGLMALRQAEHRGVFDREDRWKKHFSFSHLYTGLGYSNIQSFLGIVELRSYRRDPVPEEHVSDLGDLCLWLYGRKSTGTRPIVRSQNPDLRNLDSAIGNVRGLAALRRGLPLDVVLDISAGDERLFKGGLIAALNGLQQARGKQLTGDSGDVDTLQIANEVLDLADRLVTEMEDFRREGRARRRRKRPSRA